MSAPRDTVRPTPEALRDLGRYPRAISHPQTPISGRPRSAAVLAEPGTRTSIRPEISSASPSAQRGRKALGTGHGDLPRLCESARYRTRGWTTCRLD